MNATSELLEACGQDPVCQSSATIVLTAQGDYSQSNLLVGEYSFDLDPYAFDMNLEIDWVESNDGLVAGNCYYSYDDGETWEAGPSHSTHFESIFSLGMDAEDFSATLGSDSMADIYWGGSLQYGGGLDFSCEILE